MAPSPRDAIALRTLRMLGTRVADGSEVGWHPAVLASRVVECFNAVQVAWARRDALALRPFVSDAMYARVDHWLDGFEELSQVNRIENVRLEGTTLTRIEFGGSANQDQLLVDVAFSARDWLEDLRSGAVLDGHPDTPRRFEQQWTFIRDAELGWVIDTVGPQSAQMPTSPATAGPAPNDREPLAVPDSRPARRFSQSPHRRPATATPPPTPARPAPVAGRSSARDGVGTTTTGTRSGVLRAALILLLGVAVVAGAARVGLSLGRTSVADQGDAARARVEARQSAAGPAFRRAFNEAQASGRTAGLARGRNAGRVRGTRQGRSAGRSEGERRVAAQAAAAAAAQARTAAATSSTSGRGVAPR